MASNKQPPRSVEPGVHLCEVVEARVGTTKNSDVRWSIRLVVASGQHAGRHAAWDNLVFSPRGRPRVRRVLRAFSVEFTNEDEVEATALVGRRAIVEVRASKYEAPDGETVLRNDVPYDGYRRVRRPEEALQAIHALMDGKEWSPDTLEAIAVVVRSAGLVIRDPNLNEEGSDGS